MKAIEGVLNPIEWDDNGNIVKFCVFSDDEEDYIIEHYPKFKKLKRLLNKRVRVFGRVATNYFGEKLIYATRLRELKSRASRYLNQEQFKGSFWSDEYPVRVPREYAF